MNMLGCESLALTCAKLLRVAAIRVENTFVWNGALQCEIALGQIPDQIL